MANLGSLASGLCRRAPSSAQRKVAIYEAATITTRSQPPPEPAFLVVPDYPPRKQWPPDFSRLSQQQQYRFEKKHKRRVIYATRRPGWTKGVQIAQLSVIVCAW